MGALIGLLAAGILIFGLTVWFVAGRSRVASPLPGFAGFVKIPIRVVNGPDNGECFVKTLPDETNAFFREVEGLTRFRNFRSKIYLTFNPPTIVIDRGLYLEFCGGIEGDSPAAEQD